VISLHIRRLGVFCLVQTLVWGTMAVADEADFTFRRVKPPKAGADKRITIQVLPSIEDTSSGDSSATQAEVEQTPPAPDWFWREISPSLTAAGPGRFLQALEAIAKAPPAAVKAPRLQDLKHQAETHGRAILLATLGTRVSPALALAIIATEVEGGLGLMQLRPSVAASLTMENTLDMSANLRAGVRDLDALITQYDGDPILALAAYHAGPDALEDYAGVPPEEATRRFVPEVLAAFQVARALCLTPPELYSDGCVLQLGNARE